MNQFIKAAGLERPFTPIASTAIIVCAAYAFFRLIAILTDNIETSFLSDVTSILEMLISVTVSLLTILFLLAAMQYVARRRA